MNEEWRPVVGFEGLYEVSSLGAVRSVDRVVYHPSSGFLTLKGRVLKTAPATNGYLIVSLCKDGVKTTKPIHIIVCRAFIGERPDGHQAAHYDGDKYNCAAVNLRYATPHENAQDRERHGKTIKGEWHYRAKLTADDVRKIRTLQIKVKDIAELFGVTPGNISSIRSRKHWRHIV